ncbi:MAG: flagellar basal-body rod protein FlgG [Gammaproteobacteria bacterium]|nr:flagellar basal-body rod protein FlgG [Gammaproteobacteria bacterium]
MNPALWIAKTGLDAQQTRMAVVSNNLANVSTNGFKRDRANFEDLFYQNMRSSGGQTSQTTTQSSGMNVGTGVRIVSTDKQYTQGNLQQTDNSLDLAINGRGFFEVSLPDGSVGYTRDGSFKLDGNGTLVTSSGYPLEPQITVPDGAIAIDVGNDGTVSVRMSGEATPIDIGQITTVDFINPVGLSPMGENILQETAASGAPTQGTPGLAGLGQVRQGFLETSNVNIVEEMIAMIETQRAYEMNSKSISTTDEMLRQLNNAV